MTQVTRLSRDRSHYSWGSKTLSTIPYHWDETWNMISKAFRHAHCRQRIGMAPKSVQVSTYLSTFYAALNGQVQNVGSTSLTLFRRSSLSLGIPSSNRPATDDTARTRAVTLMQVLFLPSCRAVCYQHQLLDSLGPLGPNIRLGTDLPLFGDVNRVRWLPRSTD